MGIDRDSLVFFGNYFYIFIKSILANTFAHINVELFISHVDFHFHLVIIGNWCSASNIAPPPQHFDTLIAGGRTGVPRPAKGACAPSRKTLEPVRNITDFSPRTPLFVDPFEGGVGDTQMYTDRVWRVYP